MKLQSTIIGFVKWIVSYLTCIISTVHSHSSLLNFQNSLSLTVLTFFYIWNWAKEEDRRHISHLKRKKKVFLIVFFHLVQDWSCRGDKVMLLHRKWNSGTISSRFHRKSSHSPYLFYLLQSIILKDIFFLKVFWGFPTFLLFFFLVFLY